jgi:glyoxylase-like metal-dependent hydrolase (beta-lactamase superfamily II)
MFRGPGEPVARQLDGTELAAPDLVYDEAYDLDPGGRVVRLRAAGRAHSRGDQVVTVPDAGVMFTGDLVEAAQAAAVRHPRTQLTSASRPCDTKGKPLRPRGSRRRPGHTGQRTAPPARTETDMKLKNGRDYET